MLKRAYRLRISISSRSSRCCFGGGGGEGEEEGLGGARIMPVLVSNSISGVSRRALTMIDISVMGDDLLDYWWSSNRFGRGWSRWWWRRRRFRRRRTDASDDDLLLLYSGRSLWLSTAVDKLFPLPGNMTRRRGLPVYHGLFYSLSRVVSSDLDVYFFLSRPRSSWSLTTFATNVHLNLFHGWSLPPSRSRGFFLPFGFARMPRPWAPFFSSDDNINLLVTRWSSSLPWTLFSSDVHI